MGGGGSSVYIIQVPNSSDDALRNIDRGYLWRSGTSRGARERKERRIKKKKEIKKKSARYERTMREVRGG